MQELRESSLFIVTVYTSSSLEFVSFSQRLKVLSISNLEETEYFKDWFSI
jgi:hypothetical protein